MKLAEYRIRLGWSRAELARNAGISNPTVTKAENGENINEKTASLICRALSKKLGRQVTFQDIEDLNVVV
jgi:DNA-binding XRE family transcriptional regulator